MKRKLVVKHEGKQTRHRLGVGFVPNKETEIVVKTPREFLQIRAVRDFKIVEDVNLEEDEKSSNEAENGSNNDQELNGESNQEPKETKEDHEDNGQETSDNQDEDQNELEELYNDLNVEETKKFVEEGHIDVDQALAYELKNKNRSTVIEFLESYKADEGKEGDN